MSECVGPLKTVTECQGVKCKHQKVEFWTVNTTEDDDAAKNDKDDKDDEDDESACVIQCPWSGQPKVQ